MFDRMLGYANHLGLYAEQTSRSVKRSVTSHKPSPISH